MCPSVIYKTQVHVHVTSSVIISVFMILSCNCLLDLSHVIQINYESAPFIYYYIVNDIITTGR